MRKIWRAAPAGTDGGLRLPGWLKGVLFFFLLLALLEGGLRVAGLLYSGARPSVYGGYGTEPSRTVLCVGDSYTFGGNVSWRDAYPYRLWLRIKDIPDVRVVNAGHCEYNSAQVRSELGEELRAHKPAVVVLLVGSSDKWNLIGTDPADKTAICRPGYEASLEAAGGGAGPLDGFRVYKMARSIYLNLLFRRLLREAARIDPAALERDYRAGTLSDDGMAAGLESLYYKGRYESIFDLALAAIEKVPASSPYYSRNLSYYFTMAVAFRFQSKYSAAQAADRMAAILAGRPELASNDVFMKYLNYFRGMTAAEKLLDGRLAANLDAMADAVAASGAKLIIMNYPADHTAANEALRLAARRHGAVFVDDYRAFAALAARGGRDKYLLGDDHATPAGHEEMAALLEPEIRKALR